MTCPSWCQEPGCELPYGRHLSFSVPASATPTRRNGAQAAASNQADKQKAKDLPAYKRLRQEGHQPPATAGADRLEAVAACPEHITTGLVHADPTSRSYVRPRAFGVFHEQTGRSATTPA